jgi:predicted RNA binding protein YcfA (HicA-like mRNA interferase family)
MSSEFPSLKAKRLMAVLQRQPLGYVVRRQRGSHRVHWKRNPWGHGQEES